MGASWPGGRSAGCLRSFFLPVKNQNLFNIIIIYRKYLYGGQQWTIRKDARVVELKWKTQEKKFVLVVKMMVK